MAILRTKRLSNFCNAVPLTSGYFVFDFKFYCGSEALILERNVRSGTMADEKVRHLVYPLLLSLLVPIITKRFGGVSFQIVGAKDQCFIFRDNYLDSFAVANPPFSLGIVLESFKTTDVAVPKLIRHLLSAPLPKLKRAEFVNSVVDNETLESLSLVSDFSPKFCDNISILN